MNNSFEIMDMLGQAKQYIDKAYEMLKEENALETEAMSKTNYAKWSTRERMIFGEEYKLENYGSRGTFTRRFKGMPIGTAEALIAQGFLDPEETQNDSPTVRELIDFAKDHLDANLKFHLSCFPTDRYSTSRPSWRSCPIYALTRGAISSFSPSPRS